nr:MAG TPA: hyaluronidase [Caudoviricetes sp.]
MADKNFKARIVNKNGTSAEWEKATSFVPKKGELILYTDLNKIKIGDGVTKVNDLPFSNDDKVSKAGDTMTGALKFTKTAGIQENNGDLVVGKIDGARISMYYDSMSLYSSHFNLSSPKSNAGTTVSLNGTNAKTAIDFGDSFTITKEVSDEIQMKIGNGLYPIRVKTGNITLGDTGPNNKGSYIHNLKNPTEDTDAANKKYVDDAIPTAQIEELSNAIAKAEPFFVEVTMTNPSNISANKTFAEIKTASDAGKLCYARITNSGIMVPLIAFDLRVDKRVAVFSSSNLLISTFQTISLLIAEDNSVSTETFSSQSLIEATGLLKGSGNGTITAAVAGTDYAAVDHTHDTYTATEIDAMWNAVTIS